MPFLLTRLLSFSIPSHVETTAFFDNLLHTLQHKVKSPGSSQSFFHNFESESNEHIEQALFQTPFRIVLVNVW